MKSSSRRLLFSMVTMIVCIAMLVGSTFAWFTDTSKSANNVIKPGRLDLEVTYTLDGETGMISTVRKTCSATVSLSRDTRALLLSK